MTGEERARTIMTDEYTPKHITPGRMRQLALQVHGHMSTADDDRYVEWWAPIVLELLAGLQYFYDAQELPDYDDMVKLDVEELRRAVDAFWDMSSVDFPFATASKDEILNYLYPPVLEGLEP